jgi:alpha-1,3-mannosyl-glycoprotein beta-1,2-N-acetylglucosaminyltransferase
LAKGVSSILIEDEKKFFFFILNSFWDDWMRKPEQRRDRACIRPEVSRTGISPEGKKGVSGLVYLFNDSYFLIVSIYRGQFYEGYLKKIIKNSDPIDWKTIDVSYLVKVY